MSKKPIKKPKQEWPEKRDYDRSRRFGASATEDISMGLISLTSEPPAPAGNKAPIPRRQK